MLAPGTTLHRYVVESPIGEGGMGAVYKARDTHLDRAVALKVLSDGRGGMPDQEARERLVREARAAAALSHPNAVAIYDAGDSEHGPFIVMELVDGETLRSAIQGGAAGKPSAKSIVSWMKMAAQALGEAHERGIVHRDIKPENLMLRKDGIAKVLDFGIARQGARPLDPDGPTTPNLPTLTGTGIQIGTPQYMAPEQIKGKKVDGRTDQFAWGVTAFEALTGKLPWNDTSGALGVVASILEDVPPDVATLRADVPPHVASAIARALEKRPDDRFASMRELVKALDGEEFEAPAPAAPKRIAAPAPASGNSFGATPSMEAKAQAKPNAFETRFGEGTVKAVIGKALAFEEQGGYSKSELRDAARELGIPEDALEEATHAIKADRERAAARAVDDEIRRRLIQRRRRGFINHLIAFVGVNLIIVMPGLAKGEKIWPFFVPAIGWGIGLVIHMLKAFSSHVEPDEIREEIRREDRAIAKDAEKRDALAKRLERRGRRDKMKRNAAEIGNAVEEGVASILSVAAQKIREGADRAQRVEAAGRGAPPPFRGEGARGGRVRVAPAPNAGGDTSRRAEQEAEAEREAAELEARARARR